MRSLGSAAAVVAAIREEAGAEIERLEREARETQAALAGERERPVEIPDADRRIAEARVRVARLEDDEAWSTVLEDLQERERWIERVVAAARRMAESTEHPDWVRTYTAALALEGLRILPPGRGTVTVPASMKSLFDERWQRDLQDRAGRAIEIAFGPIAAGCTIRLVDRPVAYDNSIEARERRLQSRWRAAVARAYDTLTAGAEPEAGASPRAGAA